MCRENKTRCAGNFGEEQHNGNSMGSASVGTSSPNNNRFGYSREQLERAAQTKHEWEAWLDLNPRAWGMGLDHLRGLASEGKRVSAQMLFEYIRERDFADRHGAKTRVNNSYGPIAARTIARDCPELVGKIEFRRSVVDVLGVD